MWNVALPFVIREIISPGRCNSKTYTLLSQRMENENDKARCARMRPSPPVLALSMAVGNVTLVEEDIF